MANKPEATQKKAKPEDYPVITGADKKLYLTVGKGQGEKDPHLTGTMMVGSKSVSVAGFVDRNKNQNPYIKLTRKKSDGSHEVVGYANRAKDKEGKPLNYLIVNDNDGNLFHAFLSSNPAAADNVKQVVKDVSEHFGGLKPAKTAAERASEKEADTSPPAKKKFGAK